MTTAVRKRGAMAVAKSLRREGASDDRIRVALELDGLEDEQIKDVINYVRNQPIQPVTAYAPARENDRSGMVLLGFIVFAIGAAITFFTYTAATTSPSGGSYLVAWGVMLWGLLTVGKGLLGKMD